MGMINCASALSFAFLGLTVFTGAAQGRVIVPTPIIAPQYSFSIDNFNCPDQGVKEGNRNCYFSITNTGTGALNLDDSTFSFNLTNATNTPLFNGYYGVLLAGETSSQFSSSNIHVVNPLLQRTVASAQLVAQIGTASATSNVVTWVADPFPTPAPVPVPVVNTPAMSMILVGCTTAQVNNAPTISGCQVTVSNSGNVDFIYVDALISLTSKVGNGDIATGALPVKFNTGALAKGKSYVYNLAPIPLTPYTGSTDFNLQVTGQALYNLGTPISLIGGDKQTVSVIGSYGMPYASMSASVLSCTPFSTATRDSTCQIGIDNLGNEPLAPIDFKLIFNAGQDALITVSSTDPTATLVDVDHFRIPGVNFAHAMSPSRIATGHLEVPVTIHLNSPTQGPVSLSFLIHSAASAPEVNPSVIASTSSQFTIPFTPAPPAPVPTAIGVAFTGCVPNALGTEVTGCALQVTNKSAAGTVTGGNITVAILSPNSLVNTPASLAVSFGQLAAGQSVSLPLTASLKALPNYLGQIFLMATATASPGNLFAQGQYAWFVTAPVPAPDPTPGPKALAVSIDNCVPNAAGTEVTGCVVTVQNKDPLATISGGSVSTVALTAGALVQPPLPYLMAFNALKPGQTASQPLTFSLRSVGGFKGQIQIQSSGTATPGALTSSATYSWTVSVPAPLPTPSPVPSKKPDPIPSPSPMPSPSPSPLPSPSPSPKPSPSPSPAPTAALALTLQGCTFRSDAKGSALNCDVVIQNKSNETLSDIAIHFRHTSVSSPLFYNAELAAAPFAFKVIGILTPGQSLTEHVYVFKPQAPSTTRSVSIYALGNATATSSGGTARAVSAKSNTYTK
jgi:hypothetical protein